MCVKKKRVVAAAKLQLCIKFTAHFIFFFFLRHIFCSRKKVEIYQSGEKKKKKQRGELNCLELNITGHLGAAELCCRLQGWTV